MMVISMWLNVKGEYSFKYLTIYVMQQIKTEGGLCSRFFFQEIGENRQQKLKKTIRISSSISYMTPDCMTSDCIHQFHE